MECTIIKRDGTRQAYAPQKIVQAMSKAFADTGAPVDDDRLHRLLARVEERLVPRPEGWSVEQIQDIVERVLMEEGHYNEAKSYILYRDRLRSAGACAGGYSKRLW